jgi:type IV pilus assembly protein PilM
VPRKVIGLDIGTSAVRAAEFQVEHNPARLIGYGQIGLTPGSVVDGEIQDVHAVADALTKLWDQGGFSEKRVLAGAAGLRVITREIDLPYVPDDEVAAVVQFQAADILPFPLEQTVMTSRPIGEFIDPADGTQRRRVLIAAAHRQLIDAMIAAIEQAGLQPVGIDLVSSALIRSLGSPATGGYSEAVVSIGAGLTVIAIHQSRRPEFVRTIGTGGNALTSAIASSLDLPFADAEIVKRRLGYPDPQARAAETIAARARTELVAEIRNSLEFFSSQPNHPPLGRVILTGGSLQLVGLVEEISNTLPIPVAVGSPLSQVDTSHIPITPEEMSMIDPVAATVTGLAIPEEGAELAAFNLIPPEVIARTRQRVYQRNSLAVAIVIVLVLLGTGIWRVLQVHSAENHNAHLQAELTALKNQIPNYDPVVKVHNEVISQANKLVPLVEDEVQWIAVLGQLNSFTPPGLTVSDFSASLSTGSSSASSSTSARPLPKKDLKSFILGTGSVSVTGPSLNSAAKWLSAINSAPDFTNVEVSSVSGSKSSTGLPTYSFSSTFDITGNSHTLRALNFRYPT